MSNSRKTLFQIDQIAYKNGIEMDFSIFNLNVEK